MHSYVRMYVCACVCMRVCVHACINVCLCVFCYHLTKMTWQEDQSIFLTLFGLIRIYVVGVSDQIEFYQTNTKIGHKMLVTACYHKL